MPNFPVSAVDEGYRHYAKWLCIFGVGLVASNVARTVVVAVLGALQMAGEVAPTMNKLIDGSVNNLWGHMPYIILDARGQNITEKVLFLEDTYYKEYGDNFIKIDTNSPNYTVHDFGTALVINLTAYAPDFDHVIGGTLNHFHSVLLPHLLFCWNSSSSVDVLTATTNTPESMFGDDVPGGEDFFVHQFVVAPGLYQWANLVKSIVPTKIPYWGLPGEAVPTKQQIMITAGATTPASNPPASCLHLVVRQSSVSVTQPISVVSQIIQCGTAAGGFLALVSSFFLLLFVKKNAEHEHPKHEQLSFRWRRKSYTGSSSLPEPLLASEDSELETP